MTTSFSALRTNEINTSLQGFADVFRVSNRLGIADATNVLDTEKQLMAAIPPEEWADSHHYILLHGRYVCKAQHPLCEQCSVRNLCKYYRTHNKVDNQ